ncbi:MAG: twin-arginine translocase subunit TatC [Deltaproteobacteria bacterium]|nr:twin-arginine translocase subunit TatC [Deltaproteobacteria bacterium]
MAERRASGGEAEESNGEKLPFLAHLEELRSRLIKCALGVLVGFIACYSVSDRIFDFLVRPLGTALPKEGRLTILHPTEAFMTGLKVALVAGIVFALPVILYQIWKFVAPGLYAHEKRYVWPFVSAATGFFLAGASFAYWIVFPAAFKVLLGYAGESVLPLLSMRSALDFILKLLFAFGVIFELPVAAFFLAKMGLVHYKMLSGNRGYAVIAIFVVAAVLTPTPDIFNQLLMAGPLYVLYEVSILIVRIFGPKPSAEGAAEEEAETAL